MSAPQPALRTLLDRFSAVAGTDPAAALQLWVDVSGHPDWRDAPAAVRLAALDDLAVVCSSAGDHDRAVATAEDALAATPPGEPDHPYRLSCLAARIRDRHTATGEGADLAQLVAVRRTAVDATADGAPELGTRLFALADAYRTRWRVTGDPSALDAAVEVLTSAAASADAAGGDPARCSGNLAVALADRFEAVGDPADLDAALDSAARARAASPAGHPERGTSLLVHATLLSDRYDHAGRLADLHDALGTAYLALDEPLNDRELARLQNLLGLLELDRYQVEADPAHLDDAVRWARAAVAALAATDADDPELVGYLTNLGAAHRLAFEATLAEIDWSASGDIELDISSLRAAVEAHRRAVQLVPEGSPDRPKHLINLGSALLDAAVVLPDEFGLDEAIDVLEEAVAATSSGSPHRAGRWNNLATALRARADRTAGDADIERARAAFHEACAGGGRPEEALAAAVNWCAWATERSAWFEIAAATGYGLDTADRLRRTQLTRRDRTSWLRAADGLAAAGAHALARLGDPAAAALAAERGRGLLLSDALDRDRPKLDRLVADRPALATRFRAAVTAVRREEDG
jgi:hypothetical protein